MSESVNPFSGQMKQKSDEQLLKIFKASHEYQAQAIEAAGQELRLRGIDPILIVPDPGEEIHLEKSRLEFQWYHKAGMLLLPIFIGVLFNGFASLVRSLQFLGFPFLVLCYYLLYRYLKTNGYDRMATDFKSWTSYTLYIYIGLLLSGTLVLLIALSFA